MTEFEENNETVEQETGKHKTKEKTEDDNIVFIGEKPFMNYVNSVNVQFMEKGQKQVIIKARGRFTARAIDVAEVTRKRFLKQENIQIKDIKIDSEDFENKEGKRISVSTIEIVLTRK